MKKELSQFFIRIALVAVVFVSGFIISDQVLFPSATVMKIKMALRSVVMPDTGNESNDIIWSTFLPLRVTKHDVPVERPGSGGGITSINNLLSVLSHDSRFFAYYKNGSVEPLDILTPESGFREYLTSTVV